MTERMEYNGGQIFNLSEVRVGRLPIGRMLEHASFLSEDEDTHEGIGKAREALDEHGLVVLDVHHGRFDPVGTGINLARELNFETCVVPSSFANLQRPVLDRFYDALRDQGIQLMPTYRKSSAAPEGEREIVDNRFLHP